MLTLPEIKEHPAQYYVAIREALVMPFDDKLPAIMEELFRTLESMGIQPSGPVFFKYDIVKMPELVIEFGVPVAEPVVAQGRLVTGTIPGGRYAETTYWGHYDNLMDVNAILIGWGRQTGLRWDSSQEPDGEYFAARFEIYHNSPDEEPNPDKWETTVSIKIAE